MQNNYWAKDDGETLIAHSQQVAATAEKICKMLPLLPGELNKLTSSVSEIGLLHDIGKASPGFQAMLRENVRWGHRHEILSAAIAAQIAPHLNAEELLAIITHHRSIPPAGEGLTYEKCLPDNELPFIRPNVFNELFSELEKQKEGFLKLLKFLSNERRYKWRIDNIDFKLGDIGILKQYWMRRQANGQKDKTTISQRRYASLLRGLLITADHIASAREFDLPEVPIQKNYAALIRNQELKGNKILPFQERTAETMGDTILKAPTGSGKTAAILLWAANNQAKNGRFFYVLPHTASINAMHKRLQDIFGEKTIGVLHHKNAAYLFRIFENDYSSQDAARIAQTIAGLARELYHPIRVTTPHQLLRVALKGKGWELGLAEFPNACFVFDEIHAFEPLLVGLTIVTVKWLKSIGAKVLFASATLPLFLEKILRDEIGIQEKNIIMPNPQIKGDKNVLDKIRHSIEISEGSLLSNIETVISEIEASQKTTLIVCNHVATSQAVWRRIKKRFNDTKLLHARFNAEDRFRIESEIQSKKPPKVLVATQAVEVSLDLDYDCGYIEPAPADALGQRLGRINRKGSRPAPAKVIIYEEPSTNNRGDPLYLPYDKYVTQETIRLLSQINLLTEQHLTDIVNEIYGNGYEGDSKDDYERGLNNLMIKMFDENIIAGTYKPWIEDVIEGSDGQIEVLPMELYDRFMKLKQKKRYLEAKQLLVPIQTRQFKMLLRNNVLSYDSTMEEYKTKLKYSSDSGLDLREQFENIF